ncbi:MAG: hypothetical protein ACYTDV_13860, partial [Planctomycetota bacterium]
MNRRSFLRMTGAGLSAAVGLGRLAAGRRARRPNILFFYPDQHRFDWTSMNPQMPDITPNLAALAGR